MVGSLEFMGVWSKIYRGQKSKVRVNENQTQENSSRLLGHRQRLTKWDD